MKKNKLFAIFLAVSFLTSGCVGLEELSEVTPNQPQSDNGNDTVKSTTNQLSNDFYRALITDGKYLPSQSRGATLSLNSGYNLRNFETGLLAISKKVFPTDQYFFREGQVIESATVYEWINRYSEDNPDGLNPATNGETDPAKYEPMYLAQVLEQDYMIQTENNYELGGISIGLAMNSVNPLVTDAAGIPATIPDDVLIQKGKEMANVILTRLRQNDGLKNVPIVFGIFKQEREDNIGGGVFLTEATSVEGTEVKNWSKLNEKIVILPLIKGDPTEESSSFENFKSQVQNFFPNLSGVTAKIHYTDDVPDKMVVTIMTQFYGESEIIAFAQHVTDVANKYLPKKINVEVRIMSVNGVEAFLLQDVNEGNFSYHVFD
ncbi:Protein involved in sex pheromone biosynthesis [Granulicatella balaenopterae]|uniref:Protein involved in sex pheromone biosynthesis n=1 Tax=Granulicatella balaenopterae TaxID=137733 RepID=A0A1H9M5A3_9LACT|nr:CamS family sex pheromone protein [Granulicatella balaenopterae]SER18711.1 Protein involved in sex pheromone biosynthesis [Granulicatella balaenopterae]